MWYCFTCQTCCDIYSLWLLYLRVCNIVCCKTYLLRVCNIVCCKTYLLRVCNIVLYVRLFVIYTLYDCYIYVYVTLCVVRRIYYVYVIMFYVRLFVIYTLYDCYIYTMILCCPCYAEICPKVRRYNARPEGQCIILCILSLRYILAYNMDNKILLLLLLWMSLVI